MKQYLLDTFRFNDEANKKMLDQIGRLPDPAPAIRYFSHLINSQDKWLKRVQIYPQDPAMDWWEPQYPLDRLHSEWERSLGDWLRFIETKTEEELKEEVFFVGYDGKHWGCVLQDIALQLNYHSIHHRAQLQILIREQGMKPDFIDYIGTKYRPLS